MTELLTQTDKIPTPTNGLESEPMDPVVANNVAKLSGPEMAKVVSTESWSGNAGGLKAEDGELIPCLGVNGFADTNTGTITALGNFQELDPAVVERDGEFTLRVANSRHTFQDWVVDYTFSKKPLSAEAQAKLHESLVMFNALAPERARQRVETMKKEFGVEGVKAMGYKGEL